MVQYTYIACPVRIVLHTVRLKGKYVMGVKYAFMLYLYVCWKLFVCSDKYLVIGLKTRAEIFCSVLHCCQILTVIDINR
jgi:hypothetical protein